MSKILLNHLNGHKNGNFKKFLDNLAEEPGIAWYPSAGQDFRACLYLTKQYAKVNPAIHEEPKYPNIFLFSDYYPWNSSTFLDTQIIHEDEHTKVMVQSIEELPRLDLPLDSQIVEFTKGSIATGRVIFLEVKIISDILGEFQVPVIYAFVENESFCSRILLEQHAKLSHIVHVRYGGGCGGGGKSTGVWLLNVLKRLGCEEFITDGSYGFRNGDEAALKLYPNLNGEKADFESIRTLDGRLWSHYGDVKWNIVK